jgi:hypothetical protein
VRELIVVAGSACALAACSMGDASPVARYPWIEHARVALVEEKLAIDVRDDGTVDVDAWFRFDGEGDLPERMDFPIGAGDGVVTSFVATMEPIDAPPIALRTAAVETSALPADGAIEARAIELPPNHEVRRTRLRARYRQTLTQSFRYVLQSGAYWSGPIGSLEVVVHDPRRCIGSALVEGRTPDRTQDDASTWSFANVEPRGGVVLVARAACDARIPSAPSP